MRNSKHGSGFTTLRLAALASAAVVASLSVSCGGEPSGEATQVESQAKPLDVLRTRAAAAAVPRIFRQSVRAAGTRLSDLQADSLGDNARNGLDDDDPDDGGWDFTLGVASTAHGPAQSPTNLYGGTALGLLAAIGLGEDRPRLQTAVTDAAAGIERTVAASSPPDLVFLVLAGELQENPGFAELARQRYEALRSRLGGARPLAEAIAARRHAAGQDALIAYDVTWLLLGADALDSAFPGVGFNLDARTYADVVTSDLTSASPRFDFRDRTASFYTEGLAWSLLAASFGGSSPRLVRDLRTQLFAMQNADGGFGYSGVYPASHVQSTAHAVQALSLSSGPARLRRTAREGARWLAGAQQPNGGWEVSPGIEHPLVDAEAAVAMWLSQSGAEALTPSAGAVSDLAPTLSTARSEEERTPEFSALSPTALSPTALSTSTETSQPLAL